MHHAGILAQRRAHLKTLLDAPRKAGLARFSRTYVFGDGTRGIARIVGIDRIICAFVVSREGVVVAIWVGPGTKAAQSLNPEIRVILLAVLLVWQAVALQSSRPLAEELVGA